MAKMFRGWNTRSRWWQQEVACCPNCGSVQITFIKSDKRYHCRRLYCQSVFEKPLMSTEDNRTAIVHLRRAYSKKSPLGL